MARMQASTASSVLKIHEFLGVNENPDGDTKIKTGEMAEMRNFKITKDRHLQIRPGTSTVLRLREAWDAWAAETGAAAENPRFCGAWEGMAGEAGHLLAAFGGVIFAIDPADWTCRVVGTATEDETTFFGFGGKVYLLNGHEYKSWDGGADSLFQDVVGYVPTVLTATNPAGSGTLLENLNRLNGYRRVQYSPDGTATDFQLPETDVDEIVSVDGTEETWTLDGSAGKVKFANAPASGTNTLAVTYRKGEGARQEVAGMRYAELFNGATDTRVFLYGDGSNRTIYSGVDSEKAQPSAEYFPDLYEAAIGESNTPITAMVRHYARLLVFKSGSAWSMQQSVMTKDDGTVTSAFYVIPVNRQLGNEAPGQVRLLENNPLTLDGVSVYQWRSTSTSGNITADERNARRISDRVNQTMQTFSFAKTRTFNRKRHSEYWFLSDGRAAILNYASDSWYLYTNMPFAQMLEVEDETYGFTAEGEVRHLSRQYRNDDGADIDAYAETGSMDFDRAWQMKYSPMLFVAIKPEDGARVTVTVETNRRSDYPEKVVSSSLATFSHVDFAHWSFGTNRKPQVRRVKMKVKKATFYKLIFKSISASATATVLETDIQLRYAGNVK